MNVKQLKEQLIGVPGDALILVPSRDHSYRPAQVDVSTAIAYGKGRAAIVVEDHGDQHNTPGGTRVPALIVS